MQSPAPDRTEIARAIPFYTQPGKLTEIRARTFRGDIIGDYHSDPEKLADALFTVASRPDVESVWVSLNEISPTFVPANKKRTGNANISAYRGLLWDFDPIRPTGTSATDEQKEKAFAAAMKARAFLLELGIAMLVVDSGNGTHLRIPVNVPNEAGADTLVRTVLNTASKLFSTPEVNLDTTVHNPERVVKMPGTVARKGEQQRLSRILAVPSKLEILNRADVQKLLAELLAQIPENERVALTHEAYSGEDEIASDEQVAASFVELKAFLKHGKVPWSGEKYHETANGFLHMLLMDCPFGDHGNTGDTEAWAGVNECGQKRFKCSHNTCRDRSWNEFRALLEGRYGKYRFAPPPEDPNEYEFSAKRKPDESMPEFIRRNLLWNGTVDSFVPFVLTDALGNYEVFESRAAAVTAHRESLLKEYEGDVELVELLLKRVQWKTSSSVLGMEVPGQIEMTERGNALQLLKARGRVIRYVPGKGWMGRGRTFWFRDVADSNIREQMDHVLQNADFEGDPKWVAKWRRRCQTAANLSSSIKRADALAEFRTVLSAFDSDPLMCNLRDCVLRFDKNTGELRVDKHRLDDMTTFAMPVDYHPKATCERFEAFLEWMIPDAEQRAYLQSYIGLCLAGLKTRAFLTFVGVGRNGKSVLNKVLAGLFGPVIEDGRTSNPYYVTCNMSTLTSSEEQAGAARPDLVRLDAARVIAVSESNKSNAKTPVMFNMAFLKNWTGDDPASPARGLYEAKMEDCRAFGKFFIFTNNLPDVSENTAAAWERIKVIECNSVVDPAKEDPQLHEKLLAERSGILNWALRGLAMYFANGQTIPTPASMQKSVEEYRAEDDPIRHFLQEQCREAGAKDVEGKLIETPLKILHRRFEQWYQDEIGECFIKIKAFKKGVEEARGIKSTRKRAGYYLPVALNDPPKNDEGQPLYEFAAQGEKS